MNMHDISVIFPFRNNAHTLMDALDSIGRQKGIDIEIIAVDDASTDGGGDVVRAWATEHPEKTLKLVSNAERKYALASRVEGFRQSTSPEILIMDADDELLDEDCLAKALREKQQANVELAHFKTICFENGVEIGEKSVLSPPIIGRTENIVESYISPDNFAGTFGCKICSRELIERAILWPKNIVIYTADDLFLSTMLIFVAKSYVGSNKYIYKYNMNNKLHLERISKRIHDVLQLFSILPYLYKGENISSRSIELYNLFILNYLNTQIGRLCIMLSEAGSDELIRELISDMVEPWLHEQDLLDCLIFGASYNADKILKIINTCQTSDLQTPALDSYIYRGKPESPCINSPNLFARLIDKCMYIDSESYKLYLNNLRENTSIPNSVIALIRLNAIYGCKLRDTCLIALYNATKEQLPDKKSG